MDIVTNANCNQLIRKDWWMKFLANIIKGTEEF